MPGHLFTIVGGRGFIGGALAAELRARGWDVAIATHRDAFAGRDLGHVVYASGIAASGVADAAYAVAAHVDGVAAILARARFDSLLYLSSTRVYGDDPITREEQPLRVEPARADLYRITKIAGEAVCLAHPSPHVRVARLSNVGASIRSPLFLSDVLRQAAAGGRAHVRTLPASAKDYLTVGDACRYLAEIALRGGERLYNVAAGRNVENGAIYAALERLGVTIDVVPEAALAVTPAIDAARLQREFGPPREDVLASLPALLAAFGAHERSSAG